MLNRLHLLKSRTALVIALLAGAAAISPVVGIAILPIGIWLAYRSFQALQQFPLKMPPGYHGLDPRQMSLATGNSHEADGIFFLGNEIGSGREVWQSRADSMQHTLVLGSTGAGKTQTLLNYAANALSCGGGFIFIDGGGRHETLHEIRNLCRRFNREADFLSLNFTPLACSGLPFSRSHTLNPFSMGSPDSLVQLVVSLMDDYSGDGAMWTGRATSMLTGVMRALCFLRDDGQILLSLEVVRTHLRLGTLMSLTDEARYPTMPEQMRKHIKSYLSSLPGYHPEKGARQSQTTLDQHGYLEMIFGKILGGLADVYGHIFSDTQIDVAMSDVITNRRVLSVTLPPLQNSYDGMMDIGKVIVASMKSMISSERSSGSRGDSLDSGGNHSKRVSLPFFCIFDDCGSYLVEGISVMASQARSAGLSFVYSSQDIAAMKSGNEKEALSIISNTNTKIFMRTDEIGEATQLAWDRVSMVQGVSASSDSRVINAPCGPVNLLGMADGSQVVLSGNALVLVKAFYAVDGISETADARDRCWRTLPQMAPLKRVLKGCNAAGEPESICACPITDSAVSRERAL